WCAPGTSVQTRSKNSNGWNCVAVGAVIAGVPGAAPSPVMVKLRVADHGESMKPIAPPTSCAALTLQKYVPFARPLTCAFVSAGRSGPPVLVKPAWITVAKVELVPTCHV